MKVIKKEPGFVLFCAATMNYLTPDIQTELLKAARRSPQVLLFAGDNERAKTQASELLAVHYDTYLFKVDLARMTAQHPDTMDEHLERIFARARESGDLLYFEGADTLLQGGSGETPALRAARDYFGGQLRRCRGVIIVSVGSNIELGEALQSCFGSVIHFPAVAAV